MNKSIIGILVIVVLVVAVTAAVALSGNQATQTTTSDNDTDTDVTESTDTSGSGTNNATAVAGNYKDGTYSAAGAYRTPGGQESIDVTLTLAGGVISDISVTQNASVRVTSIDSWPPGVRY